MTTAEDRAEFMALLDALEEAVELCATWPKAERIEKRRLARRAVVAAYDRVALLTPKEDTQ